MQRRGAALSGDHLRQKAVDFWSKLDAYKGKELPLFSGGWLEHFKHRRKIRAYVRHGEAGLVFLQALTSKISVHLILMLQIHLALLTQGR